MKNIEIEDDLYKYILANIKEFGETPSQILRRLLALPKIDLQSEQVQRAEDKTPVDAIVNVAMRSRENITVNTALSQEEPLIESRATALPFALSQGIRMLFEHDVFKKETVITNKFKMMLTAMYYEDNAAFVRAAKAAKGRSRDYLGQHLESLLASDNSDELAQFVASKPRQIPHTPFWVVTNANTGRKRIILTKMMVEMGYPAHLVDQIQHVI
ncbi:regulatory protein for replication initiation in SeqA family protein [Psychromonas sp. CNPT3]|uniref:regulatory protein n=1 Tax=Psychromonas sp. CNPT3 TaxID=314282 RepID=UPI00006E539B|nr:regulatory protein [Psychromonas sp. CNPT3]AGH80554.1 regulatory protein for replication initiation in SeqA family protein [Psychromonas sp. CNPT3]